MSHKSLFPQKVLLSVITGLALASLAMNPIPLSQDTPPLAVSNSVTILAAAGILAGLALIVMGILLLIRIRRE